MMIIGSRGKNTEFRAALRFGVLAGRTLACVRYPPHSPTPFFSFPSYDFGTHARPPSFFLDPPAPRHVAAPRNPGEVVRRAVRRSLQLLLRNRRRRPQTAAHPLCLQRVESPTSNLLPKSHPFLEPEPVSGTTTIASNYPPRRPQTDDDKKIAILLPFPLFPP